MDITILEYLIALEETGSLTRAAEKFFISPSALSQRLSREEQETGCTLFRRKDGQFIPTESGKIYLRYAREALRIREETYRRIRRLSSRPAALRIAASHQLLEETSEAILPLLQEQFPGSRFDLLPADSRTACQYLLNDLADIALICLPSAGDTLLEQTVLGTDRLTAVLPVSLLPPGSGDFSLDECRDLPFILLNTGSLFRPLEEEMLAAARISPGTVYEAENFLVARDLMLAGSGVTFLPESMAKAISDCRILPSAAARSYYRILAWPKYRPLSPEGEAARLLITDELAGNYEIL
ncbi:MAG TPA: LysR family transcriptional regulator [Candidatus Lachnoclostridium stercorigallinarum]|uniref:LysR family transcriptional regulator n=1 Tax=Candidatus Lachnoclostridium stercorigallinarum TaxID=2838634 RepID=A0A9D2GJ45_9FIRM|nr:LysR family transcriptional regulator [Candidatus Lachnoclostridium stercorigallinarum]